MTILQQLYWKYVRIPRIIDLRKKCVGSHQLSRDELIELVKVLVAVNPRTALEIGSYCGVSSAILASQLAAQNPSAKLYCIDPFETQKTQDGYCRERYTEERLGFSYEEKFDENVKRFSETVVKLKGYSDQVDLPPDFAPEFIFIDGDHSYEGVRKDIERFVPLLKVGGSVSFHDVTIGRAGTLRALLYTIWPAPNTKYYELVSHVGSLLTIRKKAATPPCGYDPRDASYGW